MNTSEQILVVFLSTALAIFLVVAIVAVVQFIRLVKILQRVAAKAEGFVDSAEAVSDMVRQTVGALSISRFIHGILDFVHRKQDKSDNEESKKS